MQNYKITVQYDGSRYNGWQRQGNTKNTIQERFENVLSRMCGCDVEISASGRTDAGVHASGQVANFRCDVSMSEEEILSYLNKYLPSDIKVLSLQKAGDRFHSRLNAVSKTYVYSIANQKPDVFLRKFFLLLATLTTITPKQEIILIQQHQQHFLVNNIAEHPKKQAFSGTPPAINSLPR